nr:Sperm associated antigen 1 [Polyrhizophydium stewartii]
MAARDAELQARKGGASGAAARLRHDLLAELDDQDAPVTPARPLPAIRGTALDAPAVAVSAEPCASPDSDERTISITHGPEVKTSTSKPPSKPKPKANRIKSSDYRAWDRLDIDAELAKIDQPSQPASTHPTPASSVDATRLNIPPPRHQAMMAASAASLASAAATVDPAEALHLAQHEKYKGNESFKAGEYDDALVFYTRSLTLQVTANVLTNRAATYLKLHDYESAEMDATPRTHRGKYTEALADADAAIHALDKALADDPDLARSINPVPLRASIEQARQTCDKAYRDAYGELAAAASAADGDKQQKSSAKAKTTRLQIHETAGDHDDDGDDDDQNGNGPDEDSMPHKMNVIDVDEELGNEGDDDLVFS